jgi:hypothetical protein
MCHAHLGGGRAAGSNTMRVLVVEDHIKESAATIAVGLRREGMAVHPYMSGKPSSVRRPHAPSRSRSPRS